MATIEEYMDLYAKKDPKLMDKVGMNKDQRNTVNSPCKWAAAVLETIGSGMQKQEFEITPLNQYRLAVIMRFASRDCRECEHC
jgi:hypothetical protein